MNPLSCPTGATNVLTLHESLLMRFAQEAQAQGVFVGWVDCSQHPDKSVLLAAIAKELRFPPYFGGNLDALHDMMTDLEWLNEQNVLFVLSHAGMLKENNPKLYDDLIDVFDDSVAFWQGEARVIRVIVNHA